VTVAEPAVVAKRKRVEAAGTAEAAAETTVEPEATPAPAAPSLVLPEAHHGSLVSLTTTADALRHEEIHRIRHFIVLGWLLSVATMGLVPLLDTPRWMDIAFVGALAWGMVASFYFHQRFADPQRYSVKQMARLAVIATINTHVAIFYFGAFTTTPVIMVVGIHFLASHGPQVGVTLGLIQLQRQTQHGDVVAHAVLQFEQVAPLPRPGAGRFVAIDHALEQGYQQRRKLGGCRRGLRIVQRFTFHAAIIARISRAAGSPA
jgi:hypothetical protein